MVNYKLVYFNFRGRGEPIRFLFHHAGVPFEDKQVTFEEFQPLKPTFETGQLPCLEVDGKRLFESAAIARFVAGKLDLVGKNDWEAAQADMIAGAQEDFLQSIRPVIIGHITRNESKRVEEWNKAKGTVSDQLDKFEKILKNNGSGFYVGNNITWVDFLVAEFFDKLQHYFDAGVLLKHPSCSEHVERVHNLPRIKAYCQTRIRGIF